MEKFSQNTIKDSNTESEKKLNLLTWLKTAIISLGIVASQPVFSQNLEKNDDNNKDKYSTELFQKISDFYRVESIKKEKSLEYLDTEGLSPEKILEMEKEIRDEAKACTEIAYNPEQFYLKILEKAEDVRSLLRVHFSSNDFLEKLKLNLSEEGAQAKQKEIIDNLNSVRLVVASPDSISSKSGSNAGASYSLTEHRILIPFFNLDEEMLTHELLHGAYKNDESLSKKEIEILIKNFKNDKQRNLKENKYQNSSKERIVRKKILDLEMELLGIKKYNEKFNSDHYKKLQELKTKGELPGGILDLLETSNEKQLTKLMNTIAFEDAENLSKVKNIS